MRKCIKCGLEKELEDFRKKGKWFKHTCKECLNAPLRTGKLHTGRFKKGHKPIVTFKKGRVPWNKGRKLSSEEIEKMKESFKKCGPRKDRDGKGRNTQKYRKWRTDVLDRDGNKCIKCGSFERLHCHHKVAWVEDENLRFDVDNGETLCNSCHTAHEFIVRQKAGLSTEFKQGHKTWNKGKLHSESHRDNLKRAWVKRRESGFISWNKGKTMGEETKEKIRVAAKKQYENMEIGKDGRFVKIKE